MPTEPPPTPWAFPPAREWPFQDLVGTGADLDPSTVLAAYRVGLFPMHADGRLCWWSPVRRGVLPPAALRVTRSMRQSARRFEIRVDTAFGEVVRGCADPDRPGGWIEEDVVTAYTRLHELGWAHSVECWRGGVLVGGLYGVALGGLFAGESMFHRERDASKVALMGLAAKLREDGRPRLIDVQWQTDHLASLGVVEWPRAEYLARLPSLLREPEPDWTVRPRFGQG